MSTNKLICRSCNNTGLDMFDRKCACMFSIVTPELEQVLSEIKDELSVVMIKWPPMNSAHEGYGVLLEEVDELWDHVKTKQKNRDLAKMRQEAVQVAAMAIRFAIEVCNEERGRK